jgi:hypothetical protein
MTATIEDNIAPVPVRQLDGICRMKSQESRYHLRHRAFLLSGAPMIRRWWRCHEMSDRTRLSDPHQWSPTARSLKAVLGQRLTPWSALQRPPPQPALQRRGSNLLQSVPQQRGRRPPHLWGPRPKILCRLSERWNNQFAGGVGAIKFQPRAFAPGWEVAKLLGSSTCVYGLFGNLSISPRRLMTAAPLSTRSRG